MDITVNNTLGHSQIVIITHSISSMEAQPKRERETCMSELETTKLMNLHHVTEKGIKHSFIVVATFFFMVSLSN